MLEYAVPGTRCAGCDILLMSDAHTYVEVALPLPIYRTFTYAVDRAFEHPLVPGARVLVPVRRRQAVGICVKVDVAPVPGRTYKSIVAVPDPVPALPRSLLDTCSWIARHYAAPSGIVLRSALPALLTGAATPVPRQRVRRILVLEAEWPSLMERDRVFRRAPRQRQVFELLESLGGRVPVDHLVDRLQVSAGVVDALIAADKARIALPFDRAAAIDLAGRDVLDAVKVSVNPRVIQTPNVSAVAKDGIELIATARITVRANLERLVGGAGEETIIARVGEGIVSSIGSTDSYKHTLENPDTISKTVLAKGLDSGTAFEILSIDIADVNVGRNIGAQLQTDQAEADKRVAQAKAEERRAVAVAAEQENRAHVEAMRAKVVEAEAEVPQAVAQAFREGNLGIMDYYQLQNIQSDTAMRGNIGRAAGEGGDHG